MKDCEEVKQRDPESENETNEQVEEKDQEWKIKFEEILTLVNEMSRGQKEKEEEAKASTGDFHRMVQEACHPIDLEKVLKNYIEAATEELSRKKIEFSEAREKNERPENQRNKKRSEDFQRERDIEKIKKKKNKKDDDSRKHTEKYDGSNKRRVLTHTEKRSRSKEDRIERDEKKRRKLELSL